MADINCSEIPFSYNCNNQEYCKEGISFCKDKFFGNFCEINEKISSVKNGNVVIEIVRLIIIVKIEIALKGT